MALALSAAHLRGRRIRRAGWSALAFAALQLLWLPLPTADPAGVWHGALLTALIVLPYAAAGVWALRRESRLAAAYLGAAGVYRVAIAGLAIVSVLDGSAVRDGRGPATVIASLLTVPFALFWVAGGLAAWQSRARQAQAAADV